MTQTNPGQAAPIHQVDPIQSTPIDGPPPAYEINPSTTSTTTTTAGVAAATVEGHPAETTDNAATNGGFEAPPPYCLVDPSKMRNTDHLPHYSHISPVEIIELNNNHHESSSRHHNQDAIAAWLSSGSSMDVGTDCTFLMAFVIAFFFNWLGFLAVVCLIPTIAARFGAMSGFGLSVAKWITVMRYQEFNKVVFDGPNNVTSGFQRPSVHDPAQNFVFAIVLFAGFFLFVRGLISYIAVKNRAHQQGQTADVFTWY